MQQLLGASDRDIAAGRRSYDSMVRSPIVGCIGLGHRGGTPLLRQYGQKPDCWVHRTGTSRRDAAPTTVWPEARLLGTSDRDIAAGRRSYDSMVRNPIVGYIGPGHRGGTPLLRQYGQKPDCWVHRTGASRRGAAPTTVWPEARLLGASDRDIAAGRRSYDSMISSRRSGVSPRKQITTHTTPQTGGRP